MVVQEKGMLDKKAKIPLSKFQSITVGGETQEDEGKIIGRKSKDKGKFGEENCLMDNSMKISCCCQNKNRD